MDILETGVNWLNSVRLTHLAQSVTYKRDWEEITVTATLGATTYEVADEDGLLIQAKSTDFLIAASALVLGEGIVKPKLGDQIIRTIGGPVFVWPEVPVVVTFEVLDLGGVGHYRPCDQYGTILRIHTKQIGED